MLKINTLKNPHIAMLIGVSVVLMLLAFVFQCQSTMVVTVPAEEDLYRDLGAANDMLKGYTVADPHLRGEVRWYNPLVPWLVSKLSQVTPYSTFQLYSRAGPILNLLGPIALVLFVAQLFSVRAACFALAAYLFMGQHELLSSRYPTYSPWPWPYNFSQGLALITLAGLHLASFSKHWAWHIGVGLLLGMTFLSHTAPAAIIALTVVVLCTINCAKGYWSMRESFVRLLATGIPSLLVAMTMLWPLFLAYHLKVINTAPASFTSLYIDEIAKNLLDWKNIVAIPTIAVMGRTAFKRNSKSGKFLLFLAFIFSSGAFFLYGMTAEKLRAHNIIDLVQLVPTFHFHLYVVLGFYIAFGCGCAWIVERVSENHRVRTSITLTSLLLMIGLAWPGYSKNLDTTKFVANSEKLAQTSSLKAMYEWCLTSTASNDVFLADDFYGLYAIGAAGRKVVVLDPLFTSPFVDFNQRSQDRKQLYQVLQSGDGPTFFALADKYSVSYVVTGPKLVFGLYASETREGSLAQLPQLTLVKSFGDIQIFRRMD